MSDERATEQELTRAVILAAIEWVEDVAPIEQLDGWYSRATEQFGSMKMHHTADRLVYATIALRHRMKENAAGMSLPSNTTKEAPAE